MVIDFTTYRACRRISEWVPSEYDHAAREHIEKIRGWFAEMATFVDVRNAMGGGKPGDTE